MTKPTSSSTHHSPFHRHPLSALASVWNACCQSLRLFIVLGVLNYTVPDCLLLFNDLLLCGSQACFLGFCFLNPILLFYFSCFFLFFMISSFCFLTRRRLSFSRIVYSKEGILADRSGRQASNDSRLAVLFYGPMFLLNSGMKLWGNEIEQRSTAHQFLYEIHFCPLVGGFQSMLYACCLNGISQLEQLIRLL